MNINGQDELRFDAAVSKRAREIKDVFGRGTGTVPWSRSRSLLDEGTIRDAIKVVHFNFCFCGPTKLARTSSDGEYLLPDNGLMWWEEVIKLLRDGRLVATGVDPASHGTVVDIPPRSWYAVNAGFVKGLGATDSVLGLVDVRVTSTDANDQQNREEKQEAAAPQEFSKLEIAVKEAIEQGDIPAHTVLWKTFCDNIRTKCGVKLNTRGYSNKTIDRAVKRLSMDK